MPQVFQQVTMVYFNHNNVKCEFDHLNLSFLPSFGDLVVIKLKLDALCYIFHGKMYLILHKILNFLQKIAL